MILKCPAINFKLSINKEKPKQTYAEQKKLYELFQKPTQVLFGDDLSYLLFKFAQENALKVI